MKELKELLQQKNLIILGSHEYPIDPTEVAFWGGMGEVCKNIAERLVHRGFEVLVLPRLIKEYSADKIYYEEKNGVHVLSLPIKPYEAGQENGFLYNIYPVREGITTLDHCFTTWRYLEKIGMKDPIVHVHDWLGLAWLIEAKRSNFRRIFSVHLSAERNHGNPDKRLELEKMTGDVSQKIHYVSLAQLRSCSCYKWNHEKEHYTIPNGVDIHKYVPLENPADDYVFFVGRLAPEKNVANLVNGWAIFNKKYPDIKLKIVGGSGLANWDVESTIRNLNPEQKEKVVLTLKMITEQEKISYYQNAAVSCFPSLKEAFGLVAIEAEACGKPVVVGNVGGFHENVLEGITGIHVDGNSPSCIAKGLETAYLNRKLWGKNARKLTTEFFSWDKIINQYIECLYGEATE